VIAEISSQTFDSFFAWAPWVIGAIIYFAFWVAKRHERPAGPVSAGHTYACADCGRRGSIEQMVPQHHGGAIGYKCPDCAMATQAAAH